jgi:hypothetical protein
MAFYCKEITERPFSGEKATFSSNRKAFFRARQNPNAVDPSAVKNVIYEAVNYLVNEM